MMPSPWSTSWNVICSEREDDCSAQERAILLKPLVSSVVSFSRTTSVVFFSFALSKTWLHAEDGRLWRSQMGGFRSSGGRIQSRRGGLGDSSSAAEAEQFVSLVCRGARVIQFFAKPATDPALRVNPDVARVAAQEKARKIEKALEVMSDVEGPAVDAFRAELGPALDVQIAQCESFVSRSQRRLTATGNRGGTLGRSQGQVGEVDVRGRAGPIAPFATTNTEDELARLPAQVVELQLAAQDRESAVSKGTNQRRNLV